MRRDRSEMDAIRFDLLLMAQGPICAGCGQAITVKRPAPDKMMTATIDHVIPKSAGGPDRLGNMVLMHNICNCAKADKIPTGCTLIWLLAVNSRLGVEPMRW